MRENERVREWVRENVKERERERMIRPNLSGVARKKEKIT